MSLLDQIRAAADLGNEDVLVKEWGCTVRIVEMDSTERIAFEAECDAAREANGGKEASIIERAARALRITMRDPANGQPLGEAALDVLLKKSPNVVLRLFNRSMKISKADAASKETVAGESGAAPSGASPTA